MLNLTELRKLEERATSCHSLTATISVDDFRQLLDLVEAFKEYAHALNSLSQMRGSCATASEIFDRTLKLLEDTDFGLSKSGGTH